MQLYRPVKNLRVSGRSLISRMKSAYLNTADESWICIVHDDILGKKLLKHTVVIIAFVRPNHKKVIGRNEAKVLFEQRLVQLLLFLEVVLRVLLGWFREACNDFKSTVN